MKVLFVLQKYHHGDPFLGICTSNYTIFGSAKSSGLIEEAKCFPHDVFKAQLGTSLMCEALLQVCKDLRPDLVVTDNRIPGPQRDYNEVFAEIRKIVPILCFASDIKRNTDLEREELQYADWVGIDCVLSYRVHKSKSNKVIFMYPAPDPNVFYLGTGFRDIEVSFLGSVPVEDESMRSYYINNLRSLGMNIFTKGGRGRRGLERIGEANIPIEEYSSLLRRSKVSINFAKTGGDTKPHLKGRVFEVIVSGAFLIDEEGSESSYFFELDNDYIDFHDVNSLLSRIILILAHNDLRNEMVKSAYSKVISLYTPRNMWGYIFEQIGFKIPKQLSEDEFYKAHSLIMEKIRGG